MSRLSPFIKDKVPNGMTGVPKSIKKQYLQAICWWSTKRKSKKKKKKSITLERILRPESASVSPWLLQHLQGRCSLSRFKKAQGARDPSEPEGARCHK